MYHNIQTRISVVMVVGGGVGSAAVFAWRCCDEEVTSLELLGEVVWAVDKLSRVGRVEGDELLGLVLLRGEPLGVNFWRGEFLVCCRGELV